MFDEKTVNDACDLFDEYANLIVQSGQLRFPEDKSAIMENGRQLTDEKFKPLVSSLRDAKIKFLPLYLSVDDGEVAGAYIEQQPVLWDAVASLANVITEGLCNEHVHEMYSDYSSSFLSCQHRFGSALVGSVSEHLRSALPNIRKCYARYEWEGDGRYEPPHDKSFTAPISSDDGYLIERGWRYCDADDEDASPVWVTDFEVGDFELDELLAARVEQARAILNGTVS